MIATARRGAKRTHGKKDEMIKVSIDDEFCEWAFELDGIDDYSIAKIVEIIKQATGATCSKEYQTKYHSEYVAKLLSDDKPEAA